MESTINKCIRFADDLGLRPGPDGLFIGRVQGFPVSLKFIDPDDTALLLFGIRHWSPVDSPQVKSINYDDETTGLIAERKIDIEFEDRRAWLTINEGAESIANGQAAHVLNSILRSFKHASLIGDPDVCHYCRQTKVESVTCIDGKVALICPACLNERRNKVAHAASVAEAVPVFLMAPGAALVGAVLWAFFWACWALFFEGLGEKRVWLPGGVVLVLLVGCLTGGPVGWIIKQNRKRGRAVSVAAAILFASAAVLLGELFYLAWLIYHQFNVFSFSTALRVMPRYYLHNDPEFLIYKVLNALAAIAAAEVIARPKNAALEL